MAHKEQQDFCNTVKALHPLHFDNVKAIDIGSLDVNGTNKHLFINSEYIGLDIAEGKNVDVVSIAHEYKTKKKFDCVISTEALEHDIHWKKTLKKMVQLCKKGGLVTFTCGTTGREEHGTKSEHAFASPLTVARNDEWSDYYKNLTEEEVNEVLKAKEIFSDFDFITNGSSHDLYFWGVKK